MRSKVVGSGFLAPIMLAFVLQAKGLQEASHTSQGGNAQEKTSAVAPSGAAPASKPHEAVVSAPVFAPALVVLKDGKLEVRAFGSGLEDVLIRIGAISGMVIDGVVESYPVYGTFGPQDPREVLSELLVGSGYNYLMFGVSAAGTPKELRLTQQAGKASPPPPPSAMPATEPEVPGPGAVVHVPPPPPDDPQERVRNNLKRLQQMHDSQTGPPQ